MRHVFPRRWLTEAGASQFKLLAVDLSSVSETSRRDLWFRTIRDGDAPQTDIYATKTYDEAVAIADILEDSIAARQAAGVAAYSLDITVDGTRNSITLTNQVGLPPSLSDLGITYEGAAAGGSWNATFGYTASPEQAVTEEIDYILQQYMSAGQSLEDFTSARIIRGPDELQVLSIAPNIVASIAGSEDAETAAGRHGINVRGTVIVACRNLTSKGEAAYDNALKYAGAVRSILGDEKKTLNGLTPEVVIGAVEGPELIAGPDEPGYMGARVTYLARFPDMMPDR